MSRVSATLLGLLFLVVPLSGCVDDELTPEGDGTTEETDPTSGDTATVGIFQEETATPEPAPVTDENNGFGATQDPDEEPTPDEGTPTPTSGPDDESPDPTPNEEPTASPSPTSTTTTTTPSPSPTTTTTTPTPSPSPTSTTTTTTPAPAEAWPEEGSFVTYRTNSGGGSPGGEYRTETRSTISLTYNDGAWSGTCTWERTERYETYDDASGTYEWNNSTGSEAVTYAPPRAETDVTFGATLHVPALFGCTTETMEDLTVEDRTSHSAPRQDDGSTSWYGYWEPEWPAYKYAYWETDGGLLLAWRDQRHYSYRDGWMADTDAPLP